MTHPRRPAAGSVEQRVRSERARHDLPTPAAPTGDPVHDARVAAAHRATATIMAGCAKRTGRL